LCCKVPVNSQCPAGRLVLGCCRHGNACQSKLTKSVYYRVQTEGLQLD
jgi:hypothetical protein